MAGSRPMVMLPGMPCGPEFYDAVIAGLDDLVEAHVLVPEEADMAAAAEAILVAAPPSFLLAGTAHGGAVALEVAARAPDRVAGLWLMNCNPGANPNPDNARDTAAKVRGGGYEALLADWAGRIVDPANAVARDAFLAMARAAGSERFARQCEASATRRDHWAALPAIGVPTLLLWGAEDQFVPVDIGRRMAALIPGAEFVALADCRHFAAVERPAATVAAARAWLEGPVIATARETGAA